MSMGTHLIVNMYGCPREHLERADIVLELMNKIVEKAELEKIGESSYQFEPHGATAVILLAESHISIHTWPEKDNSAAVDLFTCSGPEKNKLAYKALIELFKPDKHTTQEVQR